jgi:phosphoenolpyruvate carboxylase
MNKFVVIDIEEYNRLKELAELNQSKIDKMNNKLRKEKEEKLNKEIGACRKFVEDSYKYKDEDYRYNLSKIKDRVMDNTNMFGYVEAKSIIELINRIRKSYEIK